MIRTDLLRGKIAEKNLSQAQVARQIGLTPKTFYLKMKKGVFYSCEMDALIRVLDLRNPGDIFFAQDVSR